MGTPESPEGEQSLGYVCKQCVCATLHHSWFTKDLLSRAIALEEIQKQHWGLDAI